MIKVFSLSTFSCLLMAGCVNNGVEDTEQLSAAIKNAPVAAVLTCTPSAGAGTPAITGAAYSSLPPLLDWPRDVPTQVPDLTEPTNNRLNDLHGQLRNCSNMDLVFSSAGNYHMVLRDLFRDILIPGSPIQNWYYSTSPPVSIDQIANSTLAFGNLQLGCRPMAAAAGQGVMTTLASRGYAEGAAVRIFKNRGNVILVRKGNPKHIRNIWDLGRPDVKIITPHPCLETDAFPNYAGTIYNVAVNDPNAPGHWTAQKLFDSIFNGSQHKWLIGSRIHHREEPWAIARGDADAGIIFYHLALDAVRNFPTLFEIVPLGGTADNPQPLPGNPVNPHFAVRIAGPWTPAQLANRDLLMSALVSPQFHDLLLAHGLALP